MREHMTNQVVVTLQQEAANGQAAYRDMAQSAIDAVLDALIAEAEKYILTTVVPADEGKVMTTYSLDQWLRSFKAST